jgi:ribonucleotide monophosphatase NagD (HAD superfamily)
VPAERIVMIGDQLETDIAGATAAGIAGALVASGISRWDASATNAIVPRYLLATIEGAT